MSRLVWNHSWFTGLCFTDIDFSNDVRSFVSLATFTHVKQGGVFLHFRLSISLGRNREFFCNQHELVKR